MPRAASKRPTISGSPCACAMANPSRPSPAPSIQRRPENDRSTPNRTRSAAGTFMSLFVDRIEPGLAVEIVRRLDIAHGAGLGAHDQRMGRCAVTEAPNALKHRAVGDA